jgi:hypothetical protein
MTAPDREASADPGEVLVNAEILDGPAVARLREACAGRATAVVDLARAATITYAGYLALVEWGGACAAEGRALVLAIRQPGLWRQVSDLHLDQVVGCVSRLPPPVAMIKPALPKAAAPASPVSAASTAGAKP